MAFKLKGVTLQKPQVIRATLNRTNLSEKDSALFQTLDDMITQLEAQYENLGNKLNADGMINPDQINSAIPLSLGGATWGIYTPKVVLITNVAGFGIDDWYWTRIGDMISVSGKAQISVNTVGNPTAVAFSLPFESYFDFNYQLAGTAYSDTVVQGGAIRADLANLVGAELRFRSAVSGNYDMYLNFTYIVIPND